MKSNFVSQFISFCFLMLLVCAACFHCNAAIVENGQSSYQIYIPASASEIDKKAARQLQIYIYNTTGGHPHITNTYTGNRQIVVGCSDEALDLLKISKSSLKRDEVIIQAVGDCLVLCGEGNRGTLFAVFEYIKRELGVRYFNPREEYVPRRPKEIPLELPKQGYRHVPSVGVRNIHVNTLLQNPDFAAKLHCYGVNYTKSPEWGGIGELVLGPWHTFDRFYPADKYLSVHPEYFGLKDGKRVGGQFKGQLCLTNPDLRRDFLSIVRSEIKNAPATQLVSISQNDNNFYCECPGCTQLAEDGGSQSAPVIDFVNYMAENLESEFPQIRVQTFAYMYSRKASEKYRPGKNVDILLCAIEADVTKKLDDSSSAVNAAFLNDLRAWNRFGNSVSLWYYAVDFNNFLLPHPNYASFKNDIVLLAKCHPEFMMMECDAMNVRPITDLLVLKTYLAAEIMWNADADINAIENDFLEKYYGAAAEDVKQYLALREKTEAAIKETVTCFAYSAEWITADFLFDCLDILQRAKDRVAADMEKFNRVALLRRPFEMVLISDFVKWSRNPRCPSYESARNTAMDYLEFLKNSEVSHVGNGNSILAKKQQVERFVNYPPEPLKSNDFLGRHAEDEVLIFEEDAFMIWGGNDYAEIVRDPLAGNSWAVRLTHREPSWAVQLPIRSEFDMNAEYDIYAACRLENKATAGLFMFGGYDSEACVQYINENPDANRLSSDRYTYVHLGRHRLHKSGYLFFDAKKNPQIKHSFIDHLVFIRTPCSP